MTPQQLQPATTSLPHAYLVLLALLKGHLILPAQVCVADSAEDVSDCVQACDQHSVLLRAQRNVHPATQVAGSEIVLPMRSPAQLILPLHQPDAYTLLNRYARPRRP